MKVTYYPGCTLRTKAKELDIYAHRAAEVLGVELVEPDNWQCCGGVFSYAKDDVGSKLPAVRTLIDARDRGETLVTVCSACHNVIKQTNHAMKTDADFAARVNSYLAQEKDAPAAYKGETGVQHLLELLRDGIGFEALKEKVVNSLEGRKIAAYYGCLLLRPSNVMHMDDAENPQIMEDMLRALGAEAIYWPARNGCCGGYVTFEDKAQANKNSTNIAANAAACGAEMIVTACPLCKYNLEKCGTSLPVVYFTELLAEALGVKEGV